MLIFKKIKKTLALVMALAFCLCALPTVIAADENTIDPSGEPSYALSGTINSVLKIMDGSAKYLEDDSATSQITIALQGNKTDGAIFTAYKLLDIKNVGGMLQVSIPTNDSSKAQDFWNEYTGMTPGTDATINDIKNKINKFEEDSQKSSSIVDAFVKSDNKPAGTQSAAANDGKTVITTTFGFYAILQTDAPVDGYIASAPVLACLPMQETDPYGNITGNWLKSYTVKPKDDTISITKQVKATDDDETYKDETITNIGNTVSYEIIAELPTYGADIVNSTNGIIYTIEDTPDPVKAANTNALTLKSDTIKVQYTTSDNKATGTYNYMDAGAYTKNTDNNKFTITLDKEYYANNINGNYTYLKITYDATLNENALIEGATSTIGDTIYGPGNNNTAKLTYSNTSTSTAYTSADAKVYTMGLDITKVDKDSPDTTLAGAEFEVHLQQGGTDAAIEFIDITAEKGSEINYYRVATQAEIDDSDITTTTTIKVTDTGAGIKGKLMIDGLNDMKYYLKETKAPTGYNLPTELFEINVQPTAYTNETTHGDYSSDNPNVLAFDEHRLSKNISNSTGIDLPVTGGMGTIIFTAIGLLLMAGAAYFLFRGKKSSN